MIQLGDIVAAKGFEKDNFITIAKYDTTCLPRLEGTVAVNLAPGAEVHAGLPLHARGDARRADPPGRRGRRVPVPPGPDARARQGAVPRLAQAAYAAAAGIPNVALFTEQAEAFTQLLLTAAPDDEQQKDLDFLLALGDIFTLIVYGQLILEQAALSTSRTTSSTRSSRCSCGTSPRRRVAMHGKRRLDVGPAGVGARRGPQAGRRPGPLRPGLGRGRRARRRLHDDAVAATAP